MDSGGLSVAILPPGRAYYPADPAARARVEMEEGNLRRALEFFEQAMDRFSSRATRLAYARALIQAGRLSKAQSLLADFVKSHPHDAAALSAMADLLEVSEDVDQGIVYAHRAAQLRPKDAYLWKRLAQLQLHADRNMIALASAQHSLELEPDQEDLKKLAASVAARSLSLDRLPGMPAARARRPGLGAPAIPGLPSIPDPRSRVPDPRGLPPANAKGWQSCASGGRSAMGPPTA